MSNCPNCLYNIKEDTKFCPYCGFMIAEEYDAIVPDKLEFPIVTAPTISGCEIKKVLGIVTGLTARTRGMGGQIAAGIQSMFGGEVSAFTMEIEKARIQALNRMIKKARDLGANAIISLDMESSDLVGTILISATGTAGVVEPE